MNLPKGKAEIPVIPENSGEIPIDSETKKWIYQMERLKFR